MLGSPPVEELTGERVTEVICSDGATVVISDEWADTSSCRRSLGKKWTGRTLFYRGSATNMTFAGALLASICPQFTHGSARWGNSSHQVLPTSVSWGPFLANALLCMKALLVVHGNPLRDR